MIYDIAVLNNLSSYSGLPYIVHTYAMSHILCFSEESKYNHDVNHGSRRLWGRALEDD